MKSFLTWTILKLTFITVIVGGQGLGGVCSCAEGVSCALLGDAHFKVDECKLEL